MTTFLTRMSFVHMENADAMMNDLKKELKSDYEASHTDLKQDFDKTKVAVDSLTDRRSTDYPGKKSE